MKCQHNKNIDKSYIVERAGPKPDRKAKPPVPTPTKTKTPSNKRKAY